MPTSWSRWSAGPNARSDFHDDPLEEFFWQFKGNAELLMWDRGRYERDAVEGDIFLMSANARTRRSGPEADSRCPGDRAPAPEGPGRRLPVALPPCGSLVKRIEVQLGDIVADQPPTTAFRLGRGRAPLHAVRHGGAPGRDHQAWHAALARLTRTAKMMIDMHAHCLPRIARQGLRWTPSAHRGSRIEPGGERGHIMLGDKRFR